MVAVGEPRCQILLLETLLVQAGERWFTKTKMIPTANQEPPAPSVYLHGAACLCHRLL